MEMINQLLVNKTVLLACIVLVIVNKIMGALTTENIKGGSQVGKFVVNKTSRWFTEV
jgi:hypothetical protein